MLHPFVELKGNNQPGAAWQGLGEQACPWGEVDRDGAAYVPLCGLGRLDAQHPVIGSGRHRAQIDLIGCRRPVISEKPTRAPNGGTVRVPSTFSITQRDATC